MAEVVLTYFGREGTDAAVDDLLRRADITGRSCCVGHVELCAVRRGLCRCYDWMWSEGGGAGWGAGSTERSPRGHPQLQTSIVVPSRLLPSAFHCTQAYALVADTSAQPLSVR